MNKFITIKFLDKSVQTMDDVVEIKIDPELCFIQIFQIGDRYNLYRLEDIQAFESGPMTHDVGQLEQNIEEWARDRKIDAIRHVRDVTSWDLKTSKEYVEKVWL